MYVPPQIGRGDEEPPAKPNRRQRRAQAAVNRQKAKKLQKRLERDAKRAFDRAQEAQTDTAAAEYSFG